MTLDLAAPALTRPRTALLLGATVLIIIGCTDDLWADIESRYPRATDTTDATTADATGSTSTTGHEPLPPLQTATWGDDGGHGDSDVTAYPVPTTDASTGGSLDLAFDPPPEVLLFTAEKTHWDAAALVPLELDATADVTRVVLYRGKTQVGEFFPKHYPYTFTYPLISAKDNGELLKVIVEDAAGQTDEEEISLIVDLPPAGTIECMFQDQGAKQSSITALIAQQAGFVAAGLRDTGNGDRATLWRFAAADCKGSLKPLPGWPRSIDAWSALPQATSLKTSSVALAVDVGPGGSFALAATLRDVADKPIPYVAMFSATGSLVWQKLGDPGDELTGLVILPDHSVLAVGARTAALSTDVLASHYKPKGTSATIQSYTRAAPFDENEDLDLPNTRNERAHAVIMQSADIALIAGERDYRFELQPSRRSFTLRFDPAVGILDGSWTSPGDAKLHDGIRALTLCNGQALAGGWSGDGLPGDAASPLIRWLAPDGSGAKLRDASITSTRIHAIACDREGKLVSAGTFEAGALRRARVFAFLDIGDPIIKYVHSELGEDAALALACDALGFCASGGHVVVDGKQTAQLRVHNP